MVKKILLTETEIDAVLDDWGKNPGGRKYDKEVAKAQLKKLWDCINKASPETVFLLEDLTFWDDFKKEAGIE